MGRPHEAPASGEQEWPGPAHSEPQLLPPFLLRQAQKPTLVFLLSIQKGGSWGSGGCPRQEDKVEVKGPLASVSRAMSGNVVEP